MHISSVTQKCDLIEKTMTLLWIINGHGKITMSEEYLKQNPQLETMVNGAPMICDPVRVGARKMDTGFKEVLQKIHSRAPGSTLNQGSSQI